MNLKQSGICVFKVLCVWNSEILKSSILGKNPDVFVLIFKFSVPVMMAVRGSESYALGDFKT